MGGTSDNRAFQFQIPAPKGKMVEDMKKLFESGKWISESLPFFSAPVIFG
jgi:hypothetical protein